MIHLYVIAWAWTTLLFSYWQYWLILLWAMLTILRAMIIRKR